MTTSNGALLVFMDTSRQLSEFDINLDEDEPVETVVPMKSAPIKVRSTALSALKRELKEKDSQLHRALVRLATVETILAHSGSRNILLGAVLVVSGILMGFAFANYSISR